MQRLKDVMSRDVKLVTPDTTIREAAAQMRDGDFGMLPVAENDRMINHFFRWNTARSFDEFKQIQRETVAVPWVNTVASGPGGKAYGRLTIMLGCRMHVEPLFDVGASAFRPPPKITSAVVRLRPRTEAAIRIVDEELLSVLVAQAFSRRRKTMRNATRGTAAADDLEAVGIDPGSRPEQVAMASWVALANRLATAAD